MNQGARALTCLLGPLYKVTCRLICRRFIVYTCFDRDTRRWSGCGLKSLSFNTRTYPSLLTVPHVSFCRSTEGTHNIQEPHDAEIC